MATAQPATDHDEIRQWVESRGGHPARVSATGRGKDPGVLRIDFPGFSGEDTLEAIDWDEFFAWFDRNKLALLLSDEEGNRFNKLVSRTTASKKGSKKASTKKASTKKAPTKSASTKKSVSTKKSSTKKSSAKTVAAKKSSTKTASTKNASTKKSSSKKATTSKKTASKKATTSRKTAAAKKSASKKSTTSKQTTTSKKSTPSRRQATGNRSTGSANRSAGSASKTTTNRKTIQQWVEQRGGFPAHVKRTGRKKNDPGVLRIDYPGFSGTDTLERISWEEWFEAFDRNKLAFLYQEKKNSRFSKLVAR